MGTFNTAFFTAITLVSVSLYGCQKTDPKSAKQATTTADQQVKTLTIGYQKASLNFLVAKQQKQFEQQFPGAKIEWREFPAGPQMLEALSVGAVDFGYVGNTPPIFAQAAAKKISYVGYEVVSPDTQAVLIPQDSPIQTLADLKGKRIAVQKGSSAHELLAKVLQKAGLSWQDIEPVWLPPADARAAFDKKSIDAWSIWEPYLSAAEVDAHARTLAKGSEFPTTYAFYIGNPEFIAAHPQAPLQLLKGLNEADQWVLKHQDDALKIFADSTGLKTDIAKRVLDKRLKPSPILTLNPAVVQAQQDIADLFHQVQLIPAKIDIKPAVWSTPDTQTSH